MIKKGCFNHIRGVEGPNNVGRSVHTRVDLRIRTLSKTKNIDYFFLVKENRINNSGAMP